MHKIILFCKIGLFICLYYPVFLYANDTRLTIFMVINGMNKENIERLKPFLEKGGIRKIETESRHYSVTFPHKIYGGIEALTTILTGTTPNNHTINHNLYYDKNDDKVRYSLYDADYPGIGTMLRLSPRNILGYTYSDNMRLKYGSQSKIYSIGLDPQTTIVMAGHSANACCWLDSAEQQWVTTTFYPRGLPQVADNMNMANYINSVMNNNWRPQMNMSAYLSPTKQEQQKDFKYKKIEHFYHTPAVNDLVFELALQLQKSTKLGKDNVPDFLFLELTTISPLSNSDVIVSAEQEDMYLCLNQSLNNFIQKLNARIGENNYTIILLGLPYRGIGNNKMGRSNFKYTLFNMDRVTALTSSYLVARYGNRHWIKSGFGNSIYLNRKELNRNNLDLFDVQYEVAEFLMEFEGVQIAMPFKDALSHPAFLNTINKYHFGDVVFCLEPYCQSFTKEEEIYDFVYTPNPSALLWIWSPNKGHVSDYFQVEATQCIDYFME